MSRPTIGWTQSDGRALHLSPGRARNCRDPRQTAATVAVPDLQWNYLYQRKGVTGFDPFDNWKPNAGNWNLDTLRAWHKKYSSKVTYYNGVELQDWTTPYGWVWKIRSGVPVSYTAQDWYGDHGITSYTSGRPASFDDYGRKVGSSNIFSRAYPLTPASTIDAWDRRADALSWVNPQGGNAIAFDNSREELSGLTMDPVEEIATAVTRLNARTWAACDYFLDDMQDQFPEERWCRWGEGALSEIEGYDECWTLTGHTANSTCTGATVASLSVPYLGSALQPPAQWLINPAIKCSPNSDLSFFSQWHAGGAGYYDIGVSPRPWEASGWRTRFRSWNVGFRYDIHVGLLYMTPTFSESGELLSTTPGIKDCGILTSGVASVLQWVDVPCPWSAGYNDFGWLADRNAFVYGAIAWAEIS